MIGMRLVLTTDTIVGYLKQTQTRSFECHLEEKKSPIWQDLYLTCHGSASFKLSLVTAFTK